MLHLLAATALLSISSAVQHFTYEVLETHPHSPSHFTQGFLFRHSDGRLIEGTGLEGQSLLALYRSNFTVERRVRLPSSSRHFGEGIAELENILYQLTWQNKKVYTYNVDTLEFIRLLDQPKELLEGWGLTTLNQDLIASEGSAMLFRIKANYSSYRR